MATHPVGQDDSRSPESKLGISTEQYKLVLDALDSHAVTLLATEVEHPVSSDEFVSQVVSSSMPDLRSLHFFSNISLNEVDISDTLSRISHQQPWAISKKISNPGDSNSQNSLTRLEDEALDLAKFEPTRLSPSTRPKRINNTERRNTGVMPPHGARRSFDRSIDHWMPSRYDIGQLNINTHGPNHSLTTKSSYVKFCDVYYKHRSIRSITSADLVTFDMYRAIIATDATVSYDPAQHVLSYINTDAQESRLHDEEDWQQALNDCRLANKYLLTIKSYNRSECEFVCKYVVLHMLTFLVEKKGIKVPAPLPSPGFITHAHSDFDDFLDTGTSRLSLEPSLHSVKRSKRRLSSGPSSGSEPVRKSARVQKRLAPSPGTTETGAPVISRPLTPILSPMQERPADHGDTSGLDISSDDENKNDSEDIDFSYDPDYVGEDDGQSVHGSELALLNTDSIVDKTTEYIASKKEVHFDVTTTDQEISLVQLKLTAGFDTQENNDDEGDDLGGPPKVDDNAKWDAVQKL